MANDPGKNNFGSKDVIILVAGASGSGKSTFINYLFDQPVMPVEHGLVSSTADIKYSLMEEISWHTAQSTTQGYRLVLVELPGHHNSLISDKAILWDTVKWLQSTCTVATFGGVIYLANVSTNRPRLPDPDELIVLTKAFQHSPSNIYSRLALVTTQWGDFNATESTRTESYRDGREQQLTAVGWHTLISKGAKRYRFEDSRKSAETIVSALLTSVFSGEQLDISSLLSQILYYHNNTSTSTKTVSFSKILWSYLKSYLCLSAQSIRS